MTAIFEVVRKTIINKFLKDFTKRKKVRRALGLTDFAPKIFKSSATDIFFYGIWCESLVEVTVQNFRLLFLTETDLKTFPGITTTSDNEINKLSLSIIAQCFIITMKLYKKFIKI